MYFASILSSSWSALAAAPRYPLNKGDYIEFQCHLIDFGASRDSPFSPSLFSTKWKKVCVSEFDQREDCLLCNRLTYVNDSSIGKCVRLEIRHS